MAKSSEKTPAFSPYPMPDISLSTIDGQTITETSFKGRWTVVFFYPKDDTATCTKEAIDFSNSAAAFADLGVDVIGISKDSPKSHVKFIKKYDLKLTLLADETIKTIEAFDLWKEKQLYGRKYMGTERATFLIDPQGYVRKEWRNVRVDGHVDEVLMTAKEFKATAS